VAAARRRPAATRRNRLASALRHAYIAAIDRSDRTRLQEPAMNDRLALPASTRIASFAFAALLTLAILAGVDRLATGDGAAPQLAQSAAASRG
jgi:hypothetical protein